MHAARAHSSRAAAVIFLASTIAVLCSPAAALGYGWPVKPFTKQHAVRGTFGDPRYHVAGEGEGSASAFHFGVDIVARDGSPVYAVEPGVVVRRRAGSVTIGRPSGRRFGYWHVSPVVRSGTHVHMHQLLGYVQPGWGHVHFAESIRGSYRNPLRKGAISPFNDHVAPTVASVSVLDTDGATVDPGHVAGAIDVKADVYDPPQVVPKPPWDVALLAPTKVWWTLSDSAGEVVQSTTVADFELILPTNTLYSWIYAPGTYQNKPHRPGHYVFWVTHAFDTTGFPNGTYTLEVAAADTRNNIGTASLTVTIANG